MIEKASFRNFKSLRHVDVELERLTAIVGPNASGKTSILRGIHLLLQVATNDPRRLLTGSQHPLLLYSRGMTKQDLELSCTNAEAGIRLRVEPPLSAPADLLHPGSESDMFSGWEPHLEVRKSQEPGGGWGPVSADALVLQHFGSSNLLRFSASTLAEPSYSDVSKPRIETDGRGMASVLALMALNQPDRFDLLQGHLRSIIPSVRRIRFDRVPITRIETETVTIDGQGFKRRTDKEYIGDEVVIDFQGAADVPAPLASEGTLLVLGLLTAMLHSVRPKLLFLDDLDHGLHPKAQRKLIPMIRTILDEDPELQIIATTHSPYIVDELHPNEVRVTSAGEDGITTCARLDQHPDLERWKDEMWPGEFWSLVGEQWVSNGRGGEGH